MWSTRVGLTLVLGISVGLASPRSHTPILFGVHNGCRCATRDECGDGGGLIKPRQNVTDCDEGMTYCCVIVSTPSPPPQCGTHEPADVPRSSGNMALRDEFPWLVKIIAEDGGYLGSGALIDEYRVLSVAHLFQNRQPASVVLGIDTKVVNVAKTFQHDDFNEVNLHNDIAILYLEKKLHLKSLYPRVGTVCLPEKGFTGEEKCILSTFGENYHRFIRKIRMPILSGDHCEDRFRKTILGPSFILNRKSFLCAGGTEHGQDACQGHGGSPLVCKVDGSYTVAGLVSWGLTDHGDCNKDNYPGAYLNVARYRDWIDRH